MPNVMVLGCLRISVLSLLVEDEGTRGKLRSNDTPSALHGAETMLGISCGSAMPASSTLVLPSTVDMFLVGSRK
jgi:hypothetical protein